LFDRGRDYYEILGFRDTVRTILEKGRRPGLRSNGQLFDELNPTMVYDRFSTTLSGPLYVPPVATTTPAPSTHEARLSAPYCPTRTPRNRYESFRSLFNKR